ncbi:MAG: hypothetical protein R3B54_11930 [Bdellovibrionota bacterium]
MTRKISGFLLVATFALSLMAQPLRAEEEWKGKPLPTNMSFAAMAGAGVIGGTVGFGLTGAIAFKIAHEGFIPDINDQVFLEFQGGPLFLSPSAAATYGLFLRWDFHKNEDFSLYSLGGFGGTINPTRVYPRVALGLIYRLSGDFALRAELSHEFIGAGLAIDFSL